MKPFFIIFSFFIIVIISIPVICFVRRRDSVGRIAPDHQVSQFRSDNVAIKFDYPSNWTVTVNGDKKDYYSDKYINLSNPDLALSINIHLYKASSGQLTSECSKYNDCEFEDTVQYFLTDNTFFSKLTLIDNIVIPKSGGYALDQATSDGNRLTSSSFISYTIFSVFYLDGHSHLVNDIPLGNDFYTRIDYELNGAITPDSWPETKKCLTTIINSLEMIGGHQGTRTSNLFGVNELL